jgi:hypothetical protein
MHIVKRTLQGRDSKTNEAIYYTASNTPQKLPAAMGKEAVARGFAVKVEVEKKAGKASKAAVLNTTETETSTDQDVDKVGTDIDFDQSADSEQQDVNDE